MNDILRVIKEFRVDCILVYPGWPQPWQGTVLAMPMLSNQRSSPTTLTYALLPEGPHPEHWIATRQTVVCGYLAGE
jgi:hypothetical protein